MHGPPNTVTAPSSFVRRQQCRLRIGHGNRRKWLGTGQHRTTGAPSFKSCRQKTDALNAHVHWSVPRIRLQLFPPNPNILLRTRRTERTSLPRRIWLCRVGSIRSQLSVPGRKPCFRQSTEINASVIPAAPSVCPVQPFVELQGVVRPKMPETALSSTASLTLVAVPCRLA